MTIKTSHHGGDIGWANDFFGNPKDGWLDLSTGINPNQYPIDLDDKININALPSKASYDRCLQASLAYYGAADIPHEHVLLTPGSQFLISQLPYLFKKSEIAILWPTYGEHGKAWAGAGHKISFPTSLDEALTSSPDILLIVNPNNPDGKLYKQAELEEIAHHQAKRNGFLIIDEAFIDLAPNESLTSLVPEHNNLIILRSFGKFFGLAGIRLGTIIAPASLIAEFASRLGPWAVSTLTLEVAAQAHLDQNWINQQRQELKESRRKLDHLIIRTGAEVIGGTDLYGLYKLDRAADLFHHLGQNGIYIRHFEYQSDWLRFGVISESDEESWLRLEKAISNYIN